MNPGELKQSELGLFDEPEEVVLNNAQKAAVEHLDGPALVVAGAGTGKTRVITQRIAHLIGIGKAEPQEILALTFTEKAAREMAERLYDQIGWRSYQVAVLTFNAFGSELLGRYASHIGRSVSGGLLNDTQKALLLQQNIERVELSYYGPHSNIFEFLIGVVDYIGRLQNAGIGSAQYTKYASGLKPGAEMHPQDIAEQQDLAKLYELYEQLKEESGTYDFNDQLLLPLKILQQRKNLALRLSKQYKYVLVDEYQDTNKLQDDLLRSFITKEGNLFAVGDDDQAIYGFRGAEIGNILNFVDHFNVEKPLALTENYRSGQEILDSAYRLIKHNDPNRLESKLGINKKLSSSKKGSSIEFKLFESPTDELSGIAEEVQLRVEEGVEPKDIAVLSATHAPLKQLAKMLKSRNIPFALSTQVNIFEQPELKQLWYLLEWLGNKADDESISHVLISKFTGLKAEEVRKLLQQRDIDNENLEDALRKAAQSDEGLEHVVQKVDEWRAWSLEYPVSQLAYRLVFKTGLSDSLIEAAKKDDRIIRVFEDLVQLLTQMQDYETVAKDNSLVGYLKSFPKPPTIEVQEPVGDEGGVQLLTVHASKGLEFSRVYLVGCTQRSWSRGRDSGWQIPEELRRDSDFGPEHELRRLMYVAVTRAKDDIQLSASALSAGGVRQTVSPFIDELFGDLKFKMGKESTDKPAIEKLLTKIQRIYPLAGYNNTKKLPFEDSDGWLNLTVGELASYDFCPYDFYLEKVLGIKQPFGAQLAFGSAIHGAIESYYDSILRGERPVEEEVIQRLDELWSDRGYPTKKAAQQARKSAHEAVHKFVAREAKSDRQVLGSEVPIKIEIPEAKLRIRGRLDAYFKTPEGIELRDFKTGRKTDPESLSRTAKSSIQLRTYAMAFEEMTGKKVDQVVLDYVVSGVEGGARLTPKIIQNHRDKLVAIAEGVRSREFKPKPSNVHECAAIKYFGDVQDFEGYEVSDA